jgi:hypothetical protein
VTWPPARCARSVHQLPVLRRAGDGKCPRLAVDRGHFHVEVLAGLELQRPVQLDPDAADGRRQRFDPDHLARVVLDRQVRRIGIVLDLGFDHHIGFEPGAAGQALALLALEIHQREGRCLAVIDFAVHDCTLQVAHRPWQQAWAGRCRRAARRRGRSGRPRR